MTLASPAEGQSSGASPIPELIVRLSNDAPQELRQQLDGSLPKSAGPLFNGVRSTQAVFPRGTRSKQGTAGSSLQAYTLAVRDSTTLRTLIDRWSSTDGVAYVQENGTFSLNRASPSVSRTLSRVDNILADSLDHLDVIRARDEGWSITRGEESVSIGIVDSGIYLDHPDLRPSVRVNEAEDLNGNGRLDESDLNGVDDDGNGFVDDVVGYDFVDRPGVYLEGEYQTRDPDPSPDPNGAFSPHGTTVAGVATARAGDPEAGIDGVAPHTRFVPLRAFAGDGRGQTDDIAAAIVYGADIGVDVLNLSFGRPRPAPLLREAVAYALDRGTAVVASAGNELTDEPHYPSDYDGVISVVWLAEDGEGLPDFNRSQYGLRVDLGAPGSNVFTTQFPSQKLQVGEDLSVEDLYGNASGSSYSAPQVSGAAALLRSVDPDLTPASIRRILTARAADLEREDWDHTTGAGRLDVASALQSTLPGKTAIGSPANNAGFDGASPVPVVGTALDPSFDSYSVYYASRTTDLDTGDPWTRIAGPIDEQALNDTLATWDVTGLPNGEYTLRLVTRLRTGRTVEERSRVFLDDTPPSITVRFLGAGLVGGHWGVVADLQTDDPTRMMLDVHLNGTNVERSSEFVTSRHGLSVADETGDGGTASVQVRARNRAGLTATLDTTLAIPTSATNTAYFDRQSTDVPRGRLLGQTTDFDRDGAAEIVFNQLEQGGISDTLRSFEWTPGAFAPADTLIANVIPRDVGDPEGNGRRNLLTQIAAVTLLLEQETPTDFPTQQAFVDTTGADDPTSEDALIGTRLTDLDGDGNGEVFGNNQRQWRVLEWTGSSYDEILRLDNPTAGTDVDSVQNSNRFGTAAAATGDFDDDGRQDVLVGDRDGDWIVYEGRGANDAAPAWTFETDRFDAGDRFGTADWDGDGIAEFVTFSTYFPLPLAPGVLEPPLSFYHVWNETGDDEYERVYRLPIEGEASGQGSIAAADFDDDGREEIVLAYPPSVYVLDYTDSEGWAVPYHDDSRPSVAGRSMVADDVDADGRPEIVTATTGETMTLYRVQASALASPPPSWRVARPTGENGVALRWVAADADSVTVYAGAPEASLDPVQTVTDSTLTVANSAERTYALRAWRNEERSPFSERRRLRPHAPATVRAVSYPTPASVLLRFTEPLARDTRADRFQLDGTMPPGDALPSDDGRGVVLRFPDTRPDAGTLTWSGVRDTSGLAVGQTSVAVQFPKSADATLFVRSFQVLGEHQVRVRFSEPVKTREAEDPDRYQLTPTGRVVNAEQSTDDPATVTLTIDGIVVGATGRETALDITAMTSVDGSTLSKDSGALQLNQPADNLANVFVYPNPYRTQQHDRPLTIAGLPTTATIRIFSRSGQLVRVLESEGNSTGGLQWNLRNERGDLVPSGVYLIRVEAPDRSPVLKKAAVIR